MIIKRLLLVVLYVFIGSYTFPCTVIVVGKKASKDGSVIISHTDTGEDSRFKVVFGKKFKPGEMAPVFWGIQDSKLPLDDNGKIIGYIPQVEQTYTYIESAYSHINEYQLAIAESTTSQRDELIAMLGEGEQIMTIEQAQIFALQRYKTAREAVLFIGQLMETYGFLPSSGDGSESLVIADVNEAWVFEVMGVGKGWKKDSGKPGAIWAAQRVPDDHVGIIPNQSIIKEINSKNKANFLVSKNFMQFAIDKGWYNPKGNKPFVWQDVYAPLPHEWATGRFWYFYSKVAPHYYNWPDRSLKDNHLKGYDAYHQTVEPISIYPFSVKPEMKLSVQDVIDFQRTTFKGTIYDKTADTDWYISDGKGGSKLSPLATPFPTKAMRELLDITRRRNIARPMGNYGMVIQLRDWLPDAIGGVYWVYVDNQYTSPYVPIYAGAQSIAECYQIYNPDEFSDKSMRWAVDFIDNLMYLQWQEAVKDLWAVRDPFEKELFDRQADIEKQAMELYKVSPEKAKGFLTDYTNSKMEEAFKMFVDLRAKMIVKYTNNKMN